jgi:thiamine biosynthesis lipoprotein
MESLTFTALGGECELYAIDVDAATLEQARAWITRMHDRLTRFEPHSELSRLNASRGRWFAVSPELETLLRESLRAFEVSDGLVNVGVLPALLAAGYTRDFRRCPRCFTCVPARPA